MPPFGFDPVGDALVDMASGSSFLATLPAPAVPTLAIGARSDLVVPAIRAHLDGAANVVVDAGRVNQHDALPGSEAARREAALAVADLPPTCQGMLDAVVDAATGLVIDGAETGAGQVATGRIAAGRVAPG